MGDGELDRVDPGEIGGVERVLAPGPALRCLAAHRRQRVDHRIEHRHRMDAALPALALELAADVAVDHGVEDEARPPLDIVEHAVEMAFGAHHRPEMVQRLDIVELGEAGLGDHVQRLAGGIGQEMEVELLQRRRGIRPVEKHGERASGRLGANSRTGFVHDPAQIIHSAANMGEKSHRADVENGDGALRIRGTSAGLRRVKLLAKFVASQ